MQIRGRKAFLCRFLPDPQSGHKKSDSTSPFLSKMSVSSMTCFLWKLPPEIHNMIWKELFQKPSLE
jgi:hypothetical protein